jgi:hypothetical protein
MPKTPSIPHATATGMFGGSNILTPSETRASWKTTVSIIENEPMVDLREAPILTKPTK